MTADGILRNVDPAEALLQALRGYGGVGDNPAIRRDDRQLLREVLRLQRQQVLDLAKQCVLDAVADARRERSH